MEESQDSRLFLRIRIICVNTRIRKKKKITRYRWKIAHRHIYRTLWIEIHSFTENKINRRLLIVENQRTKRKNVLSVGLASLASWVLNYPKAKRNLLGLKFSDPSAPSLSSPYICFLGRFGPSLSSLGWVRPFAEIFHFPDLHDYLLKLDIYFRTWHLSLLANIR